MSKNESTSDESENEGMNVMKADLYDTILATNTPTVIRRDMRFEPRKVWAKSVRELLKHLHIQGIGVTVPRDSITQSIDIKFDGPSNMAWQSKEAAERKDEWELNCSLWDSSHPPCHAVGAERLEVCE